MARSLPFGDGRIAEKGPRESFIFVDPLTESKDMIVSECGDEINASRRPELDMLGAMMHHADGW